VEPAPLAGQDPKSCVAASYTTSACGLAAFGFIIVSTLRQHTECQAKRRAGTFFHIFSWTTRIPIFQAAQEHAMHAEPISPAPLPADSGPWYRSLTRYHWFVLTVAALGWLFDTMDQQLFNLARMPA